MRPTKRVIGQVVILACWFVITVVALDMPMGVRSALVIIANTVLTSFAFALWAAVCDGDDDNA